MQIESILIFIAFIVISSVANRRKQAQQQRKGQANRPPVESRQQPPQSPQKKTAPAARSGKRTLQDLFREMQQEMEAEYKRANQPATKQSPQKQTAPKPVTSESTGSPKAAIKEGTSRKVPPKPTAQQLRNSPVYRDEIRDTNGDRGFELTEESVLNGIIFAEVLGKPKSMRS